MTLENRAFMTEFWSLEFFKFQFWRANSESSENSSEQSDQPLIIITQVSIQYLLREQHVQAV